MRSHQVSVGAVGVRLSVLIVDDDYVPVDLAELTSATIRITRPDETSVDRAVTVSVPADEGIVYYDTTSADLTMAGTYVLQPYLVWDDGDEFWTEAVPLIVSAVGALE